VDGISRSNGLRSRQRVPEVNAIMGQVLKFRCNDVFFPEVTVSMGAAYDAAIATLPPDARSVFYFRERITKRIMRAAYAGEIDREQLRQSGLFGFRKLAKGGKVFSCTSSRSYSRERPLGSDAEWIALRPPFLS
jgi:hypothetical protein